MFFKSQSDQSQSQSEENTPFFDRSYRKKTSLFDKASHQEPGISAFDLFNGPEENQGERQKSFISQLEMEDQFQFQNQPEDQNGRGQIGDFRQFQFINHHEQKVSKEKITQIIEESRVVEVGPHQAKEVENPEKQKKVESLLFKQKQINMNMNMNKALKIEDMTENNKFNLKKDSLFKGQNSFGLNLQTFNGKMYTHNQNQKEISKILNKQMHESKQLKSISESSSSNERKEYGKQQELQHQNQYQSKPSRFRLKNSKACKASNYEEKESQNFFQQKIRVNSRVVQKQIDNQGMKNQGIKNQFNLKTNSEQNNALYRKNNSHQIKNQPEETKQTPRFNYQPRLGSNFTLKNNPPIIIDNQNQINNAQNFKRESPKNISNQLKFSSKIGNLKEERGKEEEKKIKNEGVFENRLKLSKANKFKEQIQVKQDNFEESDQNFKRNNTFQIGFKLKNSRADSDALKKSENQDIGKNNKNENSSKNISSQEDYERIFDEIPMDIEKPSKQVSKFDEIETYGLKEKLTSRAIKKQPKMELKSIISKPFQLKQNIQEKKEERMSIDRKQPNKTENSNGFTTISKSQSQINSNIEEDRATPKLLKKDFKKEGQQFSQVPIMNANTSLALKKAEGSKNQFEKYLLEIEKINLEHEKIKNRHNAAKKGYKEIYAIASSMNKKIKDKLHSQ